MSRHFHHNVHLLHIVIVNRQVIVTEFGLQCLSGRSSPATTNYTAVEFAEVRQNRLSEKNL